MNKTYLVHSGIKGQKWGLRRFQNDYGSLTAAARARSNINADRSVNMKDSYIKGQSTRGGLKGLVGASLVTTGVAKIVAGKKSNMDFTSISGKKFLNQAVLSTLIGAVVISASVKNFVQANQNRTFNTTGMGPTPENFTGKPKTMKQVIAAQNRLKNKK